MNTLIKLGLVVGLLTLSLNAGDILGAMDEQVESGMGFVYTIMKLFGFAVVIWGITDLISENQQQQDGGGKYIKAIFKIGVGGVLIAGKSLGDAINFTGGA